MDPKITNQLRVPNRDMPFPENSTVVVAHGAWADGSSWKEVILLLSKQGLQVVAAPLPLTSLSDDIVALNRTIVRTKGPLIVAGHAYAGAVIAGTDEERVKALVYVAALAPDQGETVTQVFTAMKLIRKRRSSLLTRTDGFGCLTKGSPTPSRITPQQIKLHYAKR
jgi:pimeloyl-ACP methyl ester carboxylesterase